MLEHKTAHNDEPAAKVSDSKVAQDPECQQQTTHQHVGEKSRLQGIFGSPGHHERMQPVGAVKLVVLESVDDIKAHEPEDHNQSQDNHLSYLHTRKRRAFDSQPRPYWRKRECQPEKEV